MGRRANLIKILIPFVCFLTITLLFLPLVSAGLIFPDNYYIIKKTDTNGLDNNFVPYQGATRDINLWRHSIYIEANPDQNIKVSQPYNAMDNYLGAMFSWNSLSFLLNNAVAWSYSHDPDNPQFLSLSANDPVVGFGNFTIGNSDLTVLDGNVSTNCLTLKDGNTMCSKADFNAGSGSMGGVSDGNLYSLNWANDTNQFFVRRNEPYLALQDLDDGIGEDTFTSYVTFLDEGGNEVAWFGDGSVGGQDFIMHNNKGGWRIDVNDGVGWKTALYCDPNGCSVNKSTQVDSLFGFELNDRNALFDDDVNTTRLCWNDGSGCLNTIPVLIDTNAWTAGFVSDQNKIMDNTQVISISPNDRKLYAPDGVTDTVNYGTAILTDLDGHQIFAWDGADQPQINFPNSAGYALTWSDDASVFDIGVKGDKRIDVFNNYLDAGGNSPSLYWSSRTLNDIWGISVDWTNRILNDQTATATLNWQDKNLIGTWLLNGIPINNTDTNAETACDANEFLDGDGTCISIHDLLSSTTYYPTYLTLTSATTPDNNIELMYYYDDYNFEVDEAAGANPLTLDINFSGISDFDQIVMREYYTGSASHFIKVQLWDYGDETWEDYFEFVGQSGFTTIQVPVFDPVSHIKDTNVQLRFFHVQNGVTTHRLWIDFVWLVQGNQVGGSTNLDGYARYNFGYNNFDGNGYFRTSGDLNIINNGLLRIDSKKICDESVCYMLSDLNRLEVPNISSDGNVYSLGVMRSDNNVFNVDLNNFPRNGDTNTLYVRGVLFGGDGNGGMIDVNSYYLWESVAGKTRLRIPQDIDVQDKNIISTTQDKDWALQVNDGGTTRSAIILSGTEGSVSMPRQSHVIAYNVNAQSVPPTSYVDVNFPSEEIDILSEFSNSSFTPKNDGIYAISLRLSLASLASGKYMESRFYISGGQDYPEGYSLVYSLNATATVISLVSYKRISAGTPLKVQIQHNDTVARSTPAYLSMIEIVKVA